MKKIYIFIFMFFFIFINKVEAIRFYEGDYISGEYVSKKKDGVIHYMTMKYLLDNNGNPVYCIEPFIKFNESDDYYLSDPYLNYSNDIIRKIELISYYGYGYQGRTEDKWYVITQYLIWKTVSNEDIYFTDKLNGNKITKYQQEINDIMNDVENHDYVRFDDVYKVNYGDSLNINLNGYEVVSSDYEIKNGYLYKISYDGTLSVRKISNNYNNLGEFYDGISTQDLYLRGNLDNEIIDINIEVIKGNILFDINTDIKLDNYKVCYELYYKNTLKEQICTSEDILYKSIDLRYGEYKVIQSYISDGYVIDSKEYLISLDSENYLISLSNNVIKNDLVINKYYCLLDECNNEENAKFEIYDINNNLVGNLITDINGYGSIELVYGEYIVKQVGGINGYNYVNDFLVNVDKIDYDYVFNLSSNKDVYASSILPPNTYVEYNNLWLFFVGLFFYKRLIIYIEGRLNK